MKLYEYIDEYVAENCDALGDRYTAAQVEAWRVANGYEFDVSNALQSHRWHPDERAFTSRRIGFGPGAYYEVIEREQGVRSAAVLAIHRQMAGEFSKRYVNEYVTRMLSIAKRSAKARAAITLAEAQVTAAMVALEAKIAFEESEDDE